MTSPEKPSNAAEWAKIIEGIGHGAGTAMQGLSTNAKSKMTAKEAKRRTLANLLNQAIKRDRGLYKAKQEHGDEMRDFQSQALQKMAQNFVQSSPGS